MQTKKLHNLHIYTDADYKINEFSRLRLYFTPASTHLLSPHMFATQY